MNSCSVLVPMTLPLITLLLLLSYLFLFNVLIHSNLIYFSYTFRYHNLSYCYCQLFLLFSIMCPLLIVLVLLIYLPVFFFQIPFLLKLFCFILSQFYLFTFFSNFCFLQTSFSLLFLIFPISVLGNKLN